MIVKNGLKIQNVSKLFFKTNPNSNRNNFFLNPRDFVWFISFPSLTVSKGLFSVTRDFAPSLSAR